MIRVLVEQEPEVGGRPVSGSYSQEHLSAASQFQYRRKTSFAARLPGRYTFAGSWLAK
jgi:hypothetical protein